MPKPLKIGIIGVAGIAGAHVKHLQPLADVQVTALCDINAEALGKRAAEWKVEETYTDWKEMLAKSDIDAVSVCTPNAFHAQPTIDALASGRPVLVEKPMAMTVAECERMTAAARAAKQELVIGFQWRFTPQARFLRAQRDAGVFGQIHYVRVQALRRRGIPSWGVFTDKSKQGGGALIDMGVHLVEMAYYITGGGKPVEAFAGQWTSIGDKPCAAKANWGAWKHENYTIEDAAAGMIRMADGALWAVESSFAAHIKEDCNNVSIMGSTGGACYNPLELYTDRDGYMLNCQPAVVGKDDAFTEKMKHFVEVCRGERANECPPEEGIAVQQILALIYAAAERGGAVRAEELV